MRFCHMWKNHLHAMVSLGARASKSAPPQRAHQSLYEAPESTHIKRQLIFWPILQTQEIQGSMHLGMFSMKY